MVNKEQLVILAAAAVVLANMLDDQEDQAVEAVRLREAAKAAYEEWKARGGSHDS